MTRLVFLLAIISVLSLYVESNSFLWHDYITTREAQRNQKGHKNGRLQIPDLATLLSLSSVIPKKNDPRSEKRVGLPLKWWQQRRYAPVTGQTSDLGKRPEDVKLAEVILWHIRF